MTNDFVLFPEPGEEDPVQDADLALITAYLARELSPVQIAAVQKRLDTDAAFRESVRPVIESWVLPVSYRGGATYRAASRAEAPIAPATLRDRLDAGWRRHVASIESRSTNEAEQPAGMVRGRELTNSRRTSMTRIAAVIAVIALPMATFAQAVVYAAQHPGAPGHALAERIVSPVKRPRISTGPATVGRDDRAAVALTTARMSAPALATMASDSAGAASTPMAPDRAKISALATQHLGSVIRGDTVADYIVMVFDAADRYIWSTHGMGSLSIEVGGDPRTAGERAAYLREHRTDYAGPAPALKLMLFTRRALVDSTDSARFNVTAAKKIGVKALVADTGAGGRGGRGADRSFDSAALIARAKMTTGLTQRRVDFPIVIDSGARGGRGGGGGGARGGAGRGGAVSPADSVVGPYMVTFAAGRGGRVTVQNQAYGLKEPGAGQSGIQGLASSSLALGESYTFAAGDLAPTALRVVVVHLTAGTTWKGW